MKRNIFCQKQKKPSYLAGVEGGRGKKELETTRAARRERTKDNTTRLFRAPWC